MKFDEQKVIGQNWKQPKCPSAKEYAKPVVYLHTMENCSAILRNDYCYTQQNGSISKTLC